MIYGIGTDIVYVPRIDRIFNRFGSRFAKRILTCDEFLKMNRSTSPARFLAKRFAVKEAAAKAFGTGFIDGLALSHIGILNDSHGKPSLHFHGYAKKMLIDRKISNTHVSISDDGDYAVAFVVFYCSS